MSDRRRAGRGVVLPRARPRRRDVRPRDGEGRGAEDLAEGGVPAARAGDGRLFRRDGADGSHAAERLGARDRELPGDPRFRRQPLPGVREGPRTVHDDPDEHGAGGEPPAPRSGRAALPRADGHAGSGRALLLPGELARARPYFFPFASSSRSVAGGGVRDSAEISSRSSGVMSIFTESSDACSWSTLRPPMIGAVIAGWLPVHATAMLIG